MQSIFFLNGNIDWTLTSFCTQSCARALERPPSQIYQSTWIPSGFMRSDRRKSCCIVLIREPQKVIIRAQKAMHCVCAFFWQEGRYKFTKFLKCMFFFMFFFRYFTLFVNHQKGGTQGQSIKFQRKLKKKIINSNYSGGICKNFTNFEVVLVVQKFEKKHCKNYEKRCNGPPLSERLNTSRICRLKFLKITSCLFMLIYKSVKNPLPNHIL